MSIRLFPLCFTAVLLAPLAVLYLAM